MKRFFFFFRLSELSRALSSLVGWVNDELAGEFLNPCRMARDFHFHSATAKNDGLRLYECFDFDRRRNVEVHLVDVDLDK